MSLPHAFVRLVAVAVGLGAASPAWAAVIADYRDDFTGPTPANGWSYLWNAPLDWNGTSSSDGSTNPIGTSASYAPLGWDGSRWTVDGDSNSGNGSPGRYLNLNSTGGHPGRGATQGEVPPLTVANSHDRYPIAAYTMQAGQTGFVHITDSLLSVDHAGSNGVEARVYVDDTLIGSVLVPGGGTRAFNLPLGLVNAGQTVYVGLGPNQVDGQDSFNVDFSLDLNGAADVMLWDAGGTGHGGGSGTWDQSAANQPWINGSTGLYTAWDNAQNYNAYFQGTAGTVTVAEAVTARSLTFATDGYTIDGAAGVTLTGAGSGGPGPAVIDVAGGSTTTISAPIVGGSLNKNGAGTLVLTGESTYDGNTVVDGTLRITGGGGIYTDGYQDPTVTLNPGAVLELQTWGYGNGHSLGELSYNSPQLQVNGATIRLLASSTANRGFTIGAQGATLDVPSGVSWTIGVNPAKPFEGIASTDGGTLTLTGAGTGRIDEPLSGTGGLVKSGSGTWTLTGENTYSGGTTISAGILLLGGGSAAARPAAPWGPARSRTTPRCTSSGPTTLSSPTTSQATGPFASSMARAR